MLKMPFTVNGESAHIVRFSVRDSIGKGYVATYYDPTYSKDKNIKVPKSFATEEEAREFLANKAGQLGFWKEE